MEQAGASRYWCHMCSQRVNPIMESEVMNCPVCGSGFVEETDPDSPAAPPNDSNDRALSLWAPILLGMMANPIRPRALLEAEAEAEDDADVVNVNDQEADSLMRRRRRRSSAAILQLLQTIRAGMLAGENQERDAIANSISRDGQQQRVILINPFSQTIVVQGERPTPFGSLGDYFIGPGLDLLLQHLAENDPNRYGTPPAQKDALDALPSVTIEEAMQCAVCLDECEEGAQLKEMPCKHKFHETCIVSWLELHSSCPVCRYQLPADDSKLVSSENTAAAVADNRNDSGRRFPVPLLWPFTTLFSSPTSSHDATADHDN